ncbi:hypothetical protein B4U84_24305 [Westiellopsis prolifica IICB1]|nr:hypothetical protein B4U84_24305 [Westiellopsis prolifica IICB1]
MSTIKELKAQAAALGITTEQAKQYGKLSSKAAWKRAIAEKLAEATSTVAERNESLEQASEGTNTYEPETLSSPWDEVQEDENSSKPYAAEILPTNEPSYKPLLLLPPTAERSDSLDHAVINIERQRIDESVPGSVYTPAPPVERNDLEDFSLDIEPLGVSNKPQPRPSTQKRNVLGTLKTIAECAYWFGVGFMRGLAAA